ncbi:DUF5367 family protein [Gluconacetobacter aggeris]|uniref:DUF5367 family protein n=2 Tax=Gluconacetobacter aggeris TaxID=1286186 RepID=A0A7W4NYA1_9PROT|nr:DUF5367 family protein [Gluconacetobacter aggeris]
MEGETAMLRLNQIIICSVVAFLFWALATLFVHTLPGSLYGMRGNIGFVTSIPVALLSVWLVCRLARLEGNQILSGCLFVMADAMLYDAIALRWFPTLYATDDQTCRLASAWLLWGYGISAWGALLLGLWRERAARA